MANIVMRRPNPLLHRYTVSDDQPTLETFIENSFGPRQTDTAVNYFTDLRGNVHDFKPLFRGYVCGVLELHRDNLYHGSINTDTLRVQHREGKLLCPPTDPIPARTSTVTDLNRVGEALDTVCKTRGWGLGVGVLPSSMDKCITFLKGVSEVQHCMWIEYMPFILTPYELMNTFVTKMFKVMERYDTFRIELEGKRCLYMQKAQTYGSAVIYNDVCANGGYESYAGFLRYLRKFVNHLGDKDPGYPNMLRAPGELLKFVNYVDNNFFDFIFNCAVVTHTLPCSLHRLDKRLTSNYRSI